MSNVFSDNRTDTASRVIMAEPKTIYQAFLNPKSLVLWLPPKGMSGQISNFDPREGETYNMTLIYEEDQLSSGKTSENTDIYQGKFLELVPYKRIVQLVIFDSESPDFMGEMIQKWLLESIPGGTRVTVICKNVPKGIRKEDHVLGLKSTLENLAIFVE
ncbi:SRPBCC domain-containing protein [Bacillus mesophilum]|uniref:ATPase n=1 Tax=Bacillus mesophilum TaxID=1071718 RepID=A0A7V7RK06_9BACI|nr:SRPBCC domain-containing protein [Bacillus mesophilum]KAB2331389.1 ATPase [Bacillus mesophilum]